MKMELWKRMAPGHLENRATVPSKDSMIASNGAPPMRDDDGHRSKAEIVSIRLENLES